MTSEYDAALSVLRHHAMTAATVAITSQPEMAKAFAAIAEHLRRGPSILSMDDIKSGRRFLNDLAAGPSLIRTSTTAETRQPTCPSGQGAGEPAAARCSEGVCWCGREA